MSCKVHAGVKAKYAVDVCVSQALPYFKKIANHYESTGNLEEVRSSRSG